MREIDNGDVEQEMLPLGRYEAAPTVRLIPGLWSIPQINLELIATESSNSFQCGFRVRKCSMRSWLT